MPRPPLPTPIARTLAEGRPLAVGILLFPGVEVLDFAGPFEVFSVASRLAGKRGDAGFEVSTFAAERSAVVARHGLTVLPRHGLDDAPPFDVLVVPGGVVDQPLADRRLLGYLRQAGSTVPLLASVCTGAFLLAETGLLDGRRATTHHEDIAGLRTAYPHLEVLEDVPFVDEGTVLTSAGISAGIGLSLHLVGRLLGDEAARMTARQMQYDWEPGDGEGGGG